MYLSQLILNPRCRQVQQELSNRYELHRTLMSAFPAQLPENERLLYRLEIGDSGSRITVLAQSRTAPDWAALDRPQREPYFAVPPQVKSFEPVFTPGRLLIFRLLANPTVAKHCDGKKRGQRTAIYDEAGQIAWLERKAGRHGFTIADLRVTSQGMLRGYQSQEGKRALIQLLAVQFDGLLRVEDPVLFSKSLCSGLGSGKGFGLGVISVAPA